MFGFGLSWVAVVFLPHKVDDLWVIQLVSKVVEEMCASGALKAIDKVVALVLRRRLPLTGTNCVVAQKIFRGLLEITAEPSIFKIVKITIRLARIAICHVVTISMGYVGWTILV